MSAKHKFSNNVTGWGNLPNKYGCSGVNSLLLHKSIGTRVRLMSKIAWCSLISWMENLKWCLGKKIHLSNKYGCNGVRVYCCTRVTRVRLVSNIVGCFSKQLNWTRYMYCDNGLLFYFGQVVTLIALICATTISYRGKDYLTLPSSWKFRVFDFTSVLSLLSCVGLLFIRATNIARLLPIDWLMVVSFYLNWLKINLTSARQEYYFFFGPPCGIIFSENSEKISSH